MGGAWAQGQVQRWAAPACRGQVPVAVAWACLREAEAWTVVTSGLPRASQEAPSVLPEATARQPA